MSFAGNAIIAKAKTIYANRLKPEDYDELLRLDTIYEVLAYLKKNNKFTDTLNDIKDTEIHRGQLEELINKSYFIKLARINKFVNSVDKGFFQLDMLKREIEIVLSSIRSVISGDISQSVRDLPIYFKDHASFDIELLTKSLTMKEVLFALKGTRYFDLLSPYDFQDASMIPYVKIEHDIWNMYHNTVISRITRYFRGKEHLELMRLYQTKVEIDNIIKIYRLKKFYDADYKDILGALITDRIRMPKEKLIELATIKKPEDVLKSLSNSEFAEYKDDDGYVYIEYFAEKINYNLAKRYLFISTSPAVVYSAFIILNEIEKTNLFNIIEGIRYDVDKDDIRKMLIY